MATRSPDQPSAAGPRNRGFAKRARKFANRVAALPGFAPLMLGGGAAIVIATITGPFGTTAMPLGARFGFWFAILGWNLLKWLAWFAWRVRRPTDWTMAAALGALVINVWLPLEIPLGLRLFGVDVRLVPWRIWVEALAISVVIFLVIHGIRRRRPKPAVLGEDSILFRAGVRDLAEIRAVRAEDHYCRLHLAGGQSPLVLARFADLLEELGAVDGARIHRGAWVAAAAVDGAVREGRAWRIVLTDGTRLPLSASFTATARARGWLAVRPRLEPKARAKLGVAKPPSRA